MIKYPSDATNPRPNNLTTKYHGENLKNIGWMLTKSILSMISYLVFGKDGIEIKTLNNSRKEAIAFWGGCIVNAALRLPKMQ